MDDQVSAENAAVDAASDDVIVSLDEFASLCEVTTETMRGYLKEVTEAEAAGFVDERGSHGRAYKIRARAGFAWWQELKDREAAERQSREDKLAQLRLELSGGRDDEADVYRMSGKKRREEYEAELARIKLRTVKGELVEAGPLLAVLREAVLATRKAIMTVPTGFAKQWDIDRNARVDLEVRLAAVLDGLADKLGKVETVGNSDAA